MTDISSDISLVTFETNLSMAHGGALDQFQSRPDKNGAHFRMLLGEYYRQLQYASESGGDVARFLTYCVTGFVTQFHEQLNSVYERQFRLTWRGYIAATVPGRDLSIRERRTLVAEGLFRRNIGRDQITSLSTELARTYARTTSKTLARDLEELVEAGLLLESDGSYCANTEVLLDFLPMTAPELSSETPVTFGRSGAGGCAIWCHDVRRRS